MLTILTIIFILSTAYCVYQALTQSYTCLYYTFILLLYNTAIGRQYD